MEAPETKEKISTYSSKVLEKVYSILGSKNSPDAKNEKSSDEAATSTIVIELDSSNRSFLSKVWREFCEAYMEYCAVSFPNFADAKSEDLAHFLRGRGNASMKEKQYWAASHKYTTSISQAPEGSAALALGYAKRSVASFHQNSYHVCLLDVNRALSGQCSKQLRDILMQRKGKCIELLSKLCARMRVPPKINFDATDPHEMECWLPGQRYDDSRNYSIDMYDFSNDNLPNCAPKLRLVYGQSALPILQTTESIRAGEVISAEEFVVTSVSDGMGTISCSYCLRSRMTLIPCPTCTWEFYCSEDCRKAAFVLYHAVECKMINFYTLRGKKARHYYAIALRAFLIGTEQGNKLSEVVREISKRDIFKTDYKPTCEPFVNDYIGLVELHAFQVLKEKYWKTSDFEHTLEIAIEMVIALQRMSFFGQEQTSVDFLSEAKLTSILLLMIHLMSAENDCYRIDMDSTVEPTEQVPLGYGFYMFQNFFGESCNPNVTVFIANRYRYAYAVRPIEAGEYLTYNPRPHLFAYEPFERRTNKLEPDEAKFHCEACIGDWPIMEDLSKREILFKRSKTKQKLLNLIVDMDEQSLVSPRSELDVFSLTLQLINLLYDYLRMPSYEIVWWEKFLIKLMNTHFSDNNLRRINQQQKFDKLFATLVKRIDNESDTTPHLFK